MNLASVNLIDLLGWQNVRMFANTNGGEWHHSCPVHGGKDTLVVNPTPDDNDHGLWFCRKSHEGGDAIALCQHLYNDDFIQACERLRIKRDETPKNKSAQDTTPNIRNEPAPPALWQSCATAFWEYAQDQLWNSDVGKAGRTYLTIRGLDLDDALLAGVGYNPQPLFRDRSKWGLDEKFKEDGTTPVKLWLPAGLVFPWTYRGDLWRLSVRQLASDAKAKYVNISGSANLPFGMDWLVPHKPVLLVEGVFDALLAQQYANGSGDGTLCLASCLAIGTTGGQRLQWISEIARSAPVLVALDNDDAGEQYSAFWRRIPHSLRWAPIRKDVGEMAEAGDDIRSWVYEGLEAYHNGKQTTKNQQYNAVVGY